MKNSPAQGFTLIELMVIAAIVGLLAGGAALAYFKFQTKVDVVATGQRFEALLKKADSMARSRVDKKECLTGEEFQGYQIKVAANGVNASLNQICGTSTPFSFQEVETVDLNDNTSVSRQSPGDELVYNYYTLQSSTQNEMGRSPIKFITSGDTACYTVTINDLGVVSGEFSRPCP